MAARPIGATDRGRSRMAQGLDLVAVGIVALASLVGVVLTLLTLPGTWFIILVALLCQWWREGLYEWWTIALCALLAFAGEVVEFAWSARGAKRTGGTRPGMVGSIVGGLIGAVVGTFVIPIPLLGTIIGAAVGAGLGAVAGERGMSQRTWRESAAVGRGAAVGRLTAVAIKTGIAGMIGLVLTTGAMLA